MDNASLKGFLYDHEELLRYRNYDALYEAMNKYDRKDLTNFLFNVARRNPLEYMTTISDSMFQKIELEELTIPSCIESGVVYGLKCKKIFVKKPLNGRLDIHFSYCNLGKVILEEGITSIPTSFISSGSNVDLIKLPSSVVNLNKDAFSSGNVKIIATNRREGVNRLVIPKNEIDFYKDHLKWFRDKEENQAGE